MKNYFLLLSLMLFAEGAFAAVTDDCKAHLWSLESATDGSAAKTLVEQYLACAGADANTIVLPPERHWFWKLFRSSNPPTNLLAAAIISYQPEAVKAVLDSGKFTSDDLKFTHDRELLARIRKTLADKLKTPGIENRDKIRQLFVGRSFPWSDVFDKVLCEDYTSDESTGKKLGEFAQATTIDDKALDKYLYCRDNQAGKDLNYVVPGDPWYYLSIFGGKSAQTISTNVLAVALLNGNPAVVTKVVTSGKLSADEMEFKNRPDLKKQVLEKFAAKIKAEMNAHSASPNFSTEISALKAWPAPAFKIGLLLDPADPKLLSRVEFQRFSDAYLQRPAHEQLGLLAPAIFANEPEQVKAVLESRTLTKDQIIFTARPDLLEHLLDALAEKMAMGSSVPERAKAFHTLEIWATHGLSARQVFSSTTVESYLTSKADLSPASKDEIRRIFRDTFVPPKLVRTKTGWWERLWGCGYYEWSPEKQAEQLAKLRATRDTETAQNIVKGYLECVEGVPQDLLAAALLSGDQKAVEMVLGAGGLSRNAISMKADPRMRDQVLIAMHRQLTGTRANAAVSILGTWERSGFIADSRAVKRLITGLNGAHRNEVTALFPGVDVSSAPYSAPPIDQTAQPSSCSSEGFGNALAVGARLYALETAATAADAETIVRNYFACLDDTGGVWRYKVAGHPDVPTTLFAAAIISAQEAAINLALTGENHKHLKLSDDDKSMWMDEDVLKHTLQALAARFAHEYEQSGEITHAFRALQLWRTNGLQADIYVDSRTPESYFVDDLNGKISSTGILEIQRLFEHGGERPAGVREKTRELQTIFAAALEATPDATALRAEFERIDAEEMVQDGRIDAADIISFKGNKDVLKQVLLRFGRNMKSEMTATTPPPDSLQKTLEVFRLWLDRLPNHVINEYVSGSLPLTLIFSHVDKSWISFGQAWEIVEEAIKHGANIDMPAVIHGRESVQHYILGKFRTN